MQTFTPGWNDPPSLARQNQSGSSAGVRNLLNKRVGFPISGGTSGNAQMAPIAAVPPPMVSGIAPIAPGVPPATLLATDPLEKDRQSDASQYGNSGPVPSTAPTISASPAVDNSADSIHFTNQEILSILRDALASCVNIPASTTDNITKRLDKLQVALESSSLSPACKQKMDSLVNAMKETRYTDAYNIHSAMMVEHFAEVNQWMVGVKALILECQKRGQTA